jgi:two-component sensor histidine kinase
MPMRAVLLAVAIDLANWTGRGFQRSAPWLGMRITRRVSQQLNTTIEMCRPEPGTQFAVTIPRE